jgi:hypothetical protein
MTEPPFKLPLAAIHETIEESGDGGIAHCASSEIASYLALAGTFHRELVEMLEVGCLAFRGHDQRPSR